MKPTIYVIVASFHNLPSLLPIISQQPNKVLIVKSNAIKQESVTLLTDQIKKHVKNLEDCTVLPSDSLDAESFLSITKWIIDNLHPLYEQNKQSHNWILNVTGGTKILSMLLETGSSINWNEVHYKGVKNSNITRWSVKNNERKPLQPLAVKEILPLDALSLYTKNNESKPNRIEESSSAVSIAQQIWDYYECGDDNPHTVLSKELEGIWTPNNKSSKKRLVIIPWSSFSLDKEVMIPWLNKLCSLAPTETECCVLEDGFQIPGNELKNSSKDKLLKDWKLWVQGLWLETIVNQWFSEKTIVVNRNVEISNPKRELDFVFVRNNMIQTLEAKAAPYQGNTKDIVRQIKSITKIGMHKNYLVIGPYFYKSSGMNDSKVKAFEESCEQNDIILIKNKSAFEV